MNPISLNIWCLEYPLRLMGTQIGRRVTILRLASGQLILHSTGPFSPEEVSAIRQVGTPAWLVEATRFHDTFAPHGRRAFPELPYLVPEGFSVRPGPGPIAPLNSPPPEWAPEITVLPLDGMPAVNESALLHRPSRTLIVADLVFNFGPTATPWTRFFFRHAAGIRQFPGVSRLFRSFIRDRAAFARSARQLLALDFDRLIVGHGDRIESGGKDRLKQALDDARLLD